MSWVCRIAFVWALAAIAAPAAAGLINPTGAISVVGNPSGFNLTQGGMDLPAESNTVIYGWQERQGFGAPTSANSPAGSGLRVNAVPPSGSTYFGDMTYPTSFIPQGKQVNSYLLFFDPVGTTGTVTVGGSVEVDPSEMIIGLIFKTAEINDSDVTLANTTISLCHPSVTCVVGGLRGLENSTDFVTFVNSRKIEVQFSGAEGTDQLRIITMRVPVPATLALIVPGLLALGLSSRPRRRPLASRSA